MFFERGSYDPTSVSEGRARLAQFQGATSISSNQYFGREEEEALSQASDGGVLGDGSLAGLENAARDAVSRIIANPDVQNLGESIRSGALKVCHCFFRVARGSPMNMERISPSFRIIWLKCQSASSAEMGSAVHEGGTTLQETVLFEIFDIAPVELCNVDPRRPLARRRISEVFSMIVSLTAQTTEPRLQPPSASQGMCFDVQFGKTIR
jgi:hypothetical protein